MSLNISFFTGYGNIGNYTKTRSMKQKWQNRKTTGDFSSKETKTIMYDSRNTSEKIRDMIQNEARKIMDAYKELQEKNEDPDGDRMAKIRTKYMSGAELSPDEMEYISKKDPKFYQEVKREKEELKSYEKKLKAAKTKEEAQKVIQTEATTALSKISSVVNNPHISEGDKMAVCISEYRKLVKKQEIFAKFVEKGDYGKLPTDAEKHKAEKEIREAQEKELKETGKVQRESEFGDDEEELKENEKAQRESEFRNGEKGPEDTERTQREPGKYVREKTKEPQQKSSDRADVKIQRESTEKTPSEGKVKSRIEAESTPEAIKTKRAKNNRNYKKLYSDGSSEVTISDHSWEA